LLASFIFIFYFSSLSCLSFYPVLLSGYWRSLHHRVLPSTPTQRLSLIWFYGPSPSYILQPLPSPLFASSSANCKPKFTPASVGEYVTRLIKRSAQGKKIELWKPRE
jgi:isopenicillin N synthase-like dioxygenase